MLLRRDANPSLREIQDGVIGIVQEIQENLGNLGETAFDRQIAWHLLHGQLYAALAELLPAKSQGLFNDGSQAHLLESIVVAAFREGQEPPDDLRDMGSRVF